MEHAVVAVIIWLVVVVLIPFRRIVKLRSVIFISVLWMLLIDNLSAWLGYYSYEKSLLSIGKAPVFQLLVYPGIGLLMVNWLKKEPLTKLYYIIIVACIFSMTQFVYLQRGAFRYGSYDMVAGFVHNIAALSVFKWITLAITGEETIYSGFHTRGIIKAPDPKRV